MQSYGSQAARREPAADPAVGFLPPDDPRVRGTVAAIERRPAARRLRAALRHRRSADDGLPPGEGAFLACSFWLADAYVLLGRRDEAPALFERLLALRNDLGLLGRGIRPARASGWSATSRRPSPTSRWSTPPTT